MSTLQQAIEANTAAILALTAALSAGGVQVPAVSTKREQTPKVDKTPNRATAADFDDVKLSYEADVKPFALKLVAKDKPAFLLLLEGWQVKKGAEVAPENLPEFLGQIKAALGE